MVIIFYDFYTELVTERVQKLFLCHSVNGKFGAKLGYLELWVLQMKLILIPRPGIRIRDRLLHG